MYQYSKTAVLAETTSREVNLQGILRAFVEDSADLTQIDITYQDNPGTYDREDLQLLANLNNDIVSATQTIEDTDEDSGNIIKLGYVSLLPVPNAVSAKEM